MSNEQKSENEYIEQITVRLRKDHPDPKIREELYAEGGLPDYVRVLMREVDDESVIERVVAGVRAAEDGQPAHTE